MKSALPAIVAAFFLPATGGMEIKADETPFAPNSRWSVTNEGGTVTSAMRDGSAIVLRGTGSGIGDDSGLALLTNGNYGGYSFSNETAMTARLVSLDGAGGTGEAGIRMEVTDPLWGSNIGMRMYYQPDGTLHWQAEIFTWDVPRAAPISGLSLPLWMRIQWRHGGLTGSYSADGITWTDVTDPLPVTLPLAPPALMVSSRGNEAPASARFDNIWICGGDADDNGIKDGWEMKYFDRLLGPDAVANPDGDEASTFDEWMWGTDPTQRDARPWLKVERTLESHIRLSLVGFPSRIDESARTVKFQSASAPQGPWEFLVHMDYWEPPEYWHGARLPMSGPKMFFRAVVSAPEIDPLPIDGE